MQIKYKVTGAERKALAEAVSQELKTKAQYLGAPTFAYEVGGYHIDKFGTLEGEDNLGLEDALHRQGFDAEEREYDEPDTYESGIGALDAYPDIDQHHPGQYANPDVPITEAMQRQLDEVTVDTLTIEMPLDGFTEATLENLNQLIASKATLIKKAIGADNLPVERTETTLRFPWFRSGAGGDEVNAYTCFISALCAAARKSKRVSATEKPVENEKYAFRCFLLRLGFIGEAYKESRKVLLRNLQGSGAYKHMPESGAEV